ncbi:MAG: hypothetical protein Fur002_24360 [Anaerolineales bacterium]
MPLNLRARATQNAAVEQTSAGWKLSLRGGNAAQYRNAQLDDYSSLPRGRFPHTALTLKLRARVSARNLPGTWGFGLWNDPFGLSLGFGGAPLRLPTLPNAAWFFHASKENYLSFQAHQPAHGFLAQSFCAPKFHPLLAAAGLALPFSRRAARNLLGSVIAEDGAALGVDSAEWHSYQIAWSRRRVSFCVDEVEVFESSISPNPPLGVVIWMDNQFAAFTPQGKLSAGTLANDAAWLEVENLETPL